MKSIVRNVVLMLALSAVSIMSVGIFLYDLIPNGVTVVKARYYEQDEETTKILSEAKEAQDLRTAQVTSTSSTAGSSATPKTNIVLKEYEVSKTDLAMYKQSGSYRSGRPDPFAEVKAEPVTGENTTTGTGNQASTGNTSDGTFYNSTKTK